MTEVTEKPGPDALPALLRREIAGAGPMPFARFMELALYAPGLGYYERDEAVVGRGGDFYTSVSVGSLFGELLAFQFADWLEARRHRTPGAATPLQIVECGAHNGQLAADILRWLLERRPALRSGLEYLIIEPSPRRQAWQQKRLASFAPLVRWTPQLTPPPAGVFRIMFCNELLDAMPVRRLGWDAPARRWFEWGVGWDGRRFVWARLPLPIAPATLSGEVGPTAPLATNLLPAEGCLPPEEILDVLPHEYTMEVCPPALEWWQTAAASLGDGVLMAIDYGLTIEERFIPERTHGTLRACYRHRLSHDLLAHPGQQDLTAHVDFTALQRAGEESGLKTMTYVSQGQFFTSVAARVFAKPERFGSWTHKHTRQLKTLTHPEHLGRAFRILVQTSEC